MDLNQIKKRLNKNYDLVFDKLGITYEKLGDNIYSTCPIHDESDNPRAFSYSESRGFWKCWTRDCQCEYKNDIFGLILGVLSKQKGSKLNFKDVLRWSCSLLNINQSQIININSKENNHTNDIQDDIINIFRTNDINRNQKNIKYNPKLVSTYFINRGFKKETLEYFGVGIDENMQYMNDRAIIPIHNENGTIVVGLIGRSTKEYKIPKFLLYPKGFDKRFYLYNYHRAIKRASETSTLFITEGQGDVWRLYEAGVHNVVSVFGKTITKEQEEMINKLPITHLVILTDNDQAGRESKIQIKRQLNRMYKLSFPQIYGKDVGEMSIEQIQSKILINLKGSY
jgi:DNA primase